MSRDDVLKGRPTKRTQTGCMDSPDRNLGTLNPQVPGSSPGGRVTDLEGRPTSGGMLVAAPVELHGPLLELLRSAGAEVA
jgi:hypothetical protein